MMVCTVMNKSNFPAHHFFMASMRGHGRELFGAGDGCRSGNGAAWLFVLGSHRNTSLKVLHLIIEPARENPSP